jgi:hypothetical protein
MTSHTVSIGNIKRKSEMVILLESTRDDNQSSLFLRFWKSKSKSVIKHEYSFTSTIVYHCSSYLHILCTQYDWEFVYGHIHNRFPQFQVFEKHSGVWFFNIKNKTTNLVNFPIPITLWEQVLAISLTDFAFSFQFVATSYPIGKLLQMMFWLNLKIYFLTHNHGLPPGTYCNVVGGFIQYPFAA